MFRGLMYGSYRKPRELIWIFGVLIYLALMAKPSSATCCRGSDVVLGASDRQPVCRVPFIGEDLSSGFAATT